jgi:hypothetical protein
MRLPFILFTGCLYSVLALAAGDSLPLTDYRLAWLTLHDHPELLTDARLTRFTANEVGIEASDWKALTSAVEYNSRKQGSQVTLATYEWQKLVNSQPDLARGGLLEVFMRPDAPWPFVPHPDSSVVAAFAFTHESVAGRDAAFAANELLPVSKQLLLLAAAKVPKDLYFDKSLGAFKYDFAAKAIRFPDLPGGTADVLKPIFDANSKEPQDRQYFDGLPDKAKAGANHWLASSQKDSADAKPGFPSPSPSAEWRNHMMFLDLPPVLVLELGRQLRITSIPMEAAAAEQVQKAGYTLSARVFITAERVEANHLAHPERVNNEGMALMAQLRKVDVMDAKGQVVAILRPEQLPPPMIIPAAVSAPAKAPVPTRSPAQNREEQKAASQAAAHAARSEANKEENAKRKACREQARDVAETSTGRRDAFHKCMDTN